MSIPTQNHQEDSKNTQIPNAKHSVSSFILKIQDILQDEECHELIRWNSDGSTFLIPNIDKFSNTVLPKYFKHNKYSSLVRQLNMYGFRKVKTEEAESSFAHDSFRRDDDASLHKIKRLKLKKNQSDDEEDQQFLERYSGTRRHSAFNRETCEIKKIQEQITSMNDKFKTLEDTTDSLRSTIVMQNNEIQNLMGELIQLYNSEDNKLKTLISEMAPSSQKVKSLIQQPQDLPRKRTQNPEAMNNFSTQDSSTRLNLQFKNQLQRELNLEVENKFPRNPERTTSEFNRNFATAEAPMKRAKFFGDSGKITPGENMRAFIQKQEGRNPMFRTQLESHERPRTEIKNSYSKPNDLDNVYLESPEHQPFQRFHNDNIPESIFDSPEQVDEYFGAQKRVQKDDVRGGAHRYERKNKNSNQL